MSDSGLTVYLFIYLFVYLRIYWIGNDVMLRGFITFLPEHTLACTHTDTHSHQSKMFLFHLEDTS